MRRTTAVVLMAGLALGGALLARSRAAGPQHSVPASKDGNLVVGLCDGQTSAEVPGVREGETLSRAQAQEVSERLMAEWRRKNPQARWEDAAVEVAQVPPTQAGGSGPSPGQAAAQGATPGGAGGMPSGPQGATQEGHTYGAFSQRDEAIWKAETERFVAEGDKIFHSAEQLGGTIAVSCDMCHPNAANTHPETYPKYQVQFGRVALLRDMINWCIENPVRGRPLPDDDRKLKAIEAYILAQRKGVALEYGKH
jgi:thiosulfate dehydrogenase